MTDTARSLSALQALLADNTSAAISPQDVRDFLVSALGGYAEIYVDGGAVAQSIGTTPATLTAFDTDGVYDQQATPAASADKITFNTAGVYEITLCPLSFSGSANATITMQFAIDDVAVGRAVERKLGATGDIGAASLSALRTCAANEVLTVLVSADADSKSVTVKHASLRVKRIG